MTRRRVSIGSFDYLIRASGQHPKRKLRLLFGSIFHKASCREYVFTRRIVRLVALTNSPAKAMSPL